MFKIGRNDPCPCGSKKKYKKCCINKKKFEMQMSFSKDYFRIKGENAEKIVQELATKTFLVDWCFLNPKLPNGKEICDLLVIFDNIAIIWQIKDLKFNKSGKYRKSEVDKNLRQLLGARRKLFDLEAPIVLENSRRKEEFDAKKIKNIFLISVLLGEGEEYFSLIEEIKDKTIHVFTKDFVQIILNELDTISDFVKYLHEKEIFLRSKKKRELIVSGGEEQFLAFYLMNERKFDSIDSKDCVYIESGCWENFQEKIEYKAKKKSDEISYGWDSIINRVHEGSDKYEKVARVLAYPDRFQRRCLSKTFFDAHMIAHNHNAVFKRIIPDNGTTYCFLFYDDLEPRENRKKILTAICWIARCKYPDNKKVLGIATEIKFERTSSYDFCLLDLPVWTDENQEFVEKLQKETGFFTKPITEYFHEDEYPENK